MQLLLDTRPASRLHTHVCEVKEHTSLWSICLMPNLTKAMCECASSLQVLHACHVRVRASTVLVICTLVEGDGQLGGCTHTAGRSHPCMLAARVRPVPSMQCCMRLSEVQNALEALLDPGSNVTEHKAALLARPSGQLTG